ncbi:DUF488 domain-containing protein [Kribbella jejuensis]|uniref:Uncharacterized protein DUF488 n=1 Tax=Kribbella jejuensis TaxID=236068 RepID=A0A542E806_9ACTN|nr:DUF488 domain-containing protein [Kribbella jejuensis]TQJ11478.1 uncharacterized protein DUF488 [Kribbella jejuensis]
MGRSEILSIGYEGRSQQDLLATLTSHGVTVVVDVRLNPISRKPGLSKTRLAEALAAAGIEYRHLKALGNPRTNRSPFHEGRIAEGCDEFRKLLAAPEAESALQQIVNASRHTKLAVLCFEKSHDHCHRQIVVDEVDSRESRDITYV